jgi:cytochrome c-type biogenesis protein CcmF
MRSVLGHAGVLLGVASALVGAVTVAVGLVRGRPALVRTGRTYAWMLLGGAVLAFGAMEWALLSDDFSLVYLAEHSARSTPTVFKVATAWAALEGSILLWGLVLAGYIATVAWRFRNRFDEPAVAWALVVGFGVALFFFGLMLGPADPFRTVAGAIPTDGPGPNPLLQNHPLMAFHPPVLYLGYVGFTVPFAFALGSLITGTFGAEWARVTRRWSLAAWGFLTVGIGAGAWWSYEVLGWGGYWAWDPVENASLLPWLTATAFLHSVLVQERRGALRIWNVSLVMATFALTILGTFLTRSGVIDSVHAFTESVIGPAFLSFLGVVLAVSLGLIAWRGDRFRSETAPAAPLSREGFFLANNLLLAGLAFVVLLGTLFPLLAEAVSGDRLSVGRPYFDRMTSPLALALLFLMAIAPVLNWTRDSRREVAERLTVPAATAALVMAGLVAFGMRRPGPLLAFALGAFVAASAIAHIAERWKQIGPRALFGGSGGGMVAHIGFALLAVAVAGSSAFAQRADVRLEAGDSASVLGHRFELLAVRTVAYPNRTSEVADVRIDGGRVFRPALSRFPFANQAIGTPSVQTGLTGDVYLTLLSTPGAEGGPVVIGVRVVPLAVWIWTSIGIMGLGTALALVPQRRRSRRPSGSEPAVADDESEPAEAAPADPVMEPEREPVSASAE